VKANVRFSRAAFGVLLTLSLGANVWFALHLRKSDQSFPAANPSIPPTPAQPAIAAPRLPRLALVSWEHKTTTMRGGDFGTVAARFVEGTARNEGNAEAVNATVYFSLHDKDDAKVTETSVNIPYLGTNEVWRFKTEPFKYALTAKFSRFVVP
jgi:hypothetical protein